MAKYSYVVLTKPTGDRDAEFNRWYDEQHLPEVLAVPGFTAATRYQVLSRLPDAGTPDWRYLAIYEIEADDPQVALQELMRRAQTGEITRNDVLDMDSVATLLTREISSLRK